MRTNERTRARTAHARTLSRADTPALLATPFRAVPQLEGRDVREAFRRLAALFGSRVKTVPQELLRRFQEKAAAPV